MVSKSYVVSKFAKNLVKKKPRSANDEEKCDMQCDDNDQIIREKKNNKNSKNNNLFMIHMNEMVKMKPSPMTKGIFFHGEGNRKNIKRNDNESPSFLSNYWSSMSSTVELKRARIEESLNYYITKSRLLLLKILAVCISIALIGFIVTSYLPPSSPRVNQQLLINNGDINKTIEVDIVSTSSLPYNTTTTASTNSFSSSSSSSSSTLLPIITNKNNLKIKSLLPVNDQQQQQLHQNQLNKESPHTKSYLERINFYTTSNKNLFSVKVIPTLPSISKNDKLTTTVTSPVTNYANDCESTTLPLCQGVLSYDLTNSQQKWNLTNIEYQHFQHLVNSNCSNRVHEYVCSMLEPECRTSIMKNLKPCRRICKGIFESCSHIIASSEVLTEFFDCNSFVDSNDVQQCDDITRKLKHCYDDEFQCGDLSCVPLKWRCDNIRDCANGEDETQCTFCNYDEFKCLSDQKCISDKWHCDGVEDCSDGSDESDCDIDEDGENIHDISHYDDDDDENPKFDYKDYSDDFSTADDHDDKIISTGDGIVPIFINPNSTSSTIDVANDDGDSTKQLSKRFRSTMRKIITLVQPPPSTTTTSSSSPIISVSSTTEKPNFFEETSTSITKRVTSYSTSHSSPCPEDHLRCIDGLCITLNQICDKIQDCSDNSDELHCEY